MVNSQVGRTVARPRAALDTPRFQIGSMPGPLDAQSKLVLVRRLVREGLVTILDRPRLLHRTRAAAVVDLRPRQSRNAV